MDEGRQKDNPRVIKCSISPQKFLTNGRQGAPKSVSLPSGIKKKCMVRVFSSFLVLRDSFPLLRLRGLERESARGGRRSPPSAPPCFRPPQAGFCVAGRGKKRIALSGLVRTYCVPAGPQSRPALRTVRTGEAFFLRPLKNLFSAT